MTENPYKETNAAGYDNQQKIKGDCSRTHIFIARGHPQASRKEVVKNS
jgi:hypothetical protein